MEITYDEDVGDVYRKMKSQDIRNYMQSLTNSYNSLLERLMYEPDNESIRNRMSDISNKRELLRRELIRRENESIQEITGGAATYTKRVADSKFNSANHQYDLLRIVVERFRRTRTLSLEDRENLVSDLRRMRTLIDDFNEYVALGRETGGEAPRRGWELPSRFEQVITDAENLLSSLPPVAVGAGLITRDPTIDPPKVRKMLEQIGNEKVQSLQLVRTPLSTTTRMLLNIASFGQLNKALEKQGIDKFFHLSMIINGKYVLEKNEVINLARRSGGIPNGSLDLIVPIEGGIDITIKEMLDNTKQLMGNMYGSYDAVNNNCGIFLDNILRANGLSNNNTTEFLNQPTDEVFKSFPKISEIIVKLGTTLGAVANRQLEGEGEGNYHIHNFQLYHAKISF